MNAAYAYPRVESGATFDRASVEPKVEPQVDTSSAIAAEPVAFEEFSARLDKLNLGTLFDGRFRVKKVIPVELDRSGEGVSAVWHEIDEFGHGESASEASVELARSVVELYGTLSEEQSNLGPDLQRVWAVLKSHIEPVPR